MRERGATGGTRVTLCGRCFVSITHVQQKIKCLLFKWCECARACACVWDMITTISLFAWKMTWPSDKLINVILHIQNTHTHSAIPMGKQLDRCCCYLITLSYLVPPSFHLNCSFCKRKICANQKHKIETVLSLARALAAVLLKLIKFFFVRRRCHCRRWIADVPAQLSFVSNRAKWFIDSAYTQFVSRSFLLLSFRFRHFIIINVIQFFVHFAVAHVSAHIW